MQSELRCEDTCEIWMWLNIERDLFCKIMIFLNGENLNGRLAAPTPVSDGLIWRAVIQNWYTILMWYWINGNLHKYF